MRRWFLVGLGIAIGLFFWMATRLVLISDYHYLSFENTDGVAISELGLPPDGGCFMDTIPSLYQVERANYTILISLGPHKYVPSVLISAIGNDGTLLEIKGINRSLCSSFHVNSTYEELEFGWSLPSNNYNEECRVAKLLARELYLNLKIVDVHGIIHEERLPFELRQNGYNVTIDGL